jgi:hypothetical protein
MTSASRFAKGEQKPNTFVGGRAPRSSNLCGDEAAQADVDTWRILKKALQAGLSGRSIEIEDEETFFVTRFMLEHIEKSGLRVVPAKPTSAMQKAIRNALDRGKRMSMSWVNQRTKERWRYHAAIDAAPSWRLGYEQEKSQLEDIASS